MDSSLIIAMVAAVYLFAGIVKGVIGVGMPAIAIGLLGLFMTPAQAAAIVVVPALVTNIWQCTFGGNVLALLARLWPMLAGLCMGTLLGVLLLPKGGGIWATVCLGVLLMLYATLGLVNVHFSVGKRAEKWVGTLSGIVTGVITVATGVSAIPTVPYLHALHFDRDRMVQALGLTFTVATLALGAALSHAGEIHVSLIGASMTALTAALLGVWLGQFVRQRVKPETFRLCFFLGLMALGARLALRGVF